METLTIFFNDPIIIISLLSILGAVLTIGVWPKLKSLVLKTPNRFDDEALDLLKTLLEKAVVRKIAEEKKKIAEKKKTET